MGICGSGWRRGSRGWRGRRRRRLATARARLATWARVLGTLGPEAVLARGFAIVRDERGRVLPRAAAAAGARGFEIEFADGRVRARPDNPAPARRKPEQGSLF